MSTGTKTKGKDTEIMPVVEENAPQEEKIEKIQAHFDFDDELQEAYLTLSDGKDVILKAPRTRQVLSAKKMSRRAFPEDDGVELNTEEEGLNVTVALLSLCVKKYGEQDSMSVDEILDLEIRDFTLITKAFECFRASIDME